MVLKLFVIFRLVQNYLVWRVLKDRTDYMSSELRATVLPYAEAAFGTTSEPARWDLCSFETNYKFPMPTCSLFVQEVFSETNKIVVNVVFMMIQKQASEPFLKIFQAHMQHVQDCLRMSL